MEINKLPTSFKYLPVIDKQVNLKSYHSISFSEISAMGMTMKPLSDMINTISSNGGSGLYYVEVPKGAHLAQFKNGKGYLGGTLNNMTNQVGSGQAVLSPAAFDPTMLFLSCVISSLSQKIDYCIQVGKDILQYLDLKDKSEILGSINYLNDVFDNYRHNWNNNRFIDSNLAETVSIRRKSEESIEFQKSLIIKELSEIIKIKSDKYIANKFNSIVKLLKNYQLALYMMSFSVFLEIIFNENYNPDYLNDAVRKIESYSIDYRMVYTDCYNYLKAFKESSFHAKIKDGTAKFSIGAGTAIGKIPKINKSLNEKLIDLGNHISNIKLEFINNYMKDLTILKTDYSKTVSESIKEISSSFNKDIELLFDDKNIYYLTN